MPAGGRRVLVKVRVRRVRCPVPGCQVQTFREQIPGVLDRYQRRTSRLARQVSAVARELAGGAGARLLPALGICASRHTLLCVLPRIPLPAVAVPRVLGIDDFALRRSRAYATVIIDAETGRRVGVLPGRTAGVAGAWLRGHPGVQVVCRDGSGACGEAVRRALPGAVQVSDRWHRWHGLAGAVQREVAAPSACRARAGPPQAGQRAEMTLERWQQVRDQLRERRAKEPGMRARQLPARSASSATRAAGPCSSGTSPRGGPRPPGRPCHHGARPGSCSPGPVASPPASTRSSPDSPPPAPR